MLFVVEALHWNEEDRLVVDELGKTRAAVILAVNKVDRIEDKGRLLPFLAQVARIYAFREVVPVSARTGINLERLEASVLQALPEGPNVYPEDQITDRSERFLAAELVREQLTRRYGAEIPYAVTVEIVTKGPL